MQNWTGGVVKRACIVRQKVYSMQRNLRRSAETLLKEGYEVDVICVGEKGERKQEMQKGVNVHRIYFMYHRDNVFWYIFDYAAFFILASLKLAWLSLKKRYDLIEVHTMPDFLVFVTLFPKLLGSKVILYMFENTEQLFVSSFKVSRKHIVARLIRFIAKISASYADSVIVSDGPLHKKAMESLGIPSTKITVVLNVPDNTVFDLEPTGVAEDGNHFQLVVVSTVLKRYGIQTLVKAIPLLLRDIPEVKVDIIGDGEHRPVLEQMARDLGVDGYLNFTGYINYENVPAYIANAHVCLAPMNDDVGAPNKIFEYMALGKTIVASDLPGVKALFDDKCVSYFQPGDERDLANRVLELYHSPEKRASLGRSAQALYRKYHWPAMKSEYLKVTEKLTKNGNRPV
jgi:glycosyltransferase involved in cell wall biosynthesis